MAEPMGTLELLSRELGRLFSPLSARLASGEVLTLLAELGMQLPPQLTANAGFSNALNTVATAAATLPGTVSALIAAVEANDEAGIATQSGKILQTVVQLINAIDTIGTTLDAAGPGLPGVVAADVSAFAAVLPVRIVDYLILRYLETYYPLLCANLQLLGIAERASMPSVDAAHPRHYLRRTTLSRIGDWFQSPENVMRSVYGWNDPAFDGSLLLQRINQVLFAAGLPATFVPASATAPAVLKFLIFTLQPKLASTPRALQLSADFALPAQFSFEVPLISANWELVTSVEAAFDAGLTILIEPPLAVSIQPPAGTLSGDVSLKLEGASPDPAQPFRILGKQSGTRIEAKSIDVGATGSFAWNPASNRAEADFGVEASISGGKIVLDIAGGDGFLKDVLPADGFTFNFDLTVGYSGKRGLYVSGAAGIEVALALNVSLGPIDIETLYLAIRIGPTLDLEVSVAASAEIGPISASIDHIGLLASLKFARGNLGPVDLGFAFKPPSGLGLDIDAGPISGGGFISFDSNTGRYAGVLSLSLYGLSITAIGILDTRLPGGQSGYSFLIIISVTFSGVQLGFGFTLTGVGGLCGINRSMLVDAIQAGLRQHALDAILFPPDPIKNAPQIISTLGTIYPPAIGRYVFGPMLQIGWGTPTLVRAEIGFIIEVPSPVVIAILGQLAMELPTQDEALVEFHIDVLGVIDFGQKLFSIDATIHDSRILTFTITGDMAMRLTWGDSPSFLFSVGGFNPHYQAPANFPSLRRLTLALNMDVVRLTLQAYLAVTSNSFQTGARLEIYIGADAFNIYGWLGFDALIIFSPFSFIVDFTAGLALRSGTSTIMGISVAGTLSGPSPWHVEGEAHFSILFFDIGVHVSVTIGDAKSNPLPSVNAWVPLQAAIQAQGNWSGALPAGAPQVVTYSPPEGSSAPVLVDPAGALTFRQKVLPLNQSLGKFGEAVPDQQAEFDLAGVTIDGQDAPFNTVTDEFAPGQFQKLSDAEKLSLPSFEPMVAGFSINHQAVDFGKQYDVDIEFETIIVDSVHARRLGPLYALTRNSAIAMSRGGAAARGSLFTTGIHASDPDPSAPQLVALDLERYVIAGVDDLAVRNDLGAPATKSAMYAALTQHLAQNPADQGRLQVVPLYELEAAA
jgi:uncharacterized protein DUF6603